MEPTAAAPIGATLLSALCAGMVLLSGEAAAQTRSAERKVDLELVLAADISGSMDIDEAALERQGFADAIRDPQVIDAIQRGWLGRIAVTYVEWAGQNYQRTLVDWTEISDAASAEAFAVAIESHVPRTEMYTSISALLLYATATFENNGFDGLRQVIDVSGDGPNNRGVHVLAARERALAAGVVINGLPIVNDRLGPYGLPPLKNLDLYYEDCVIGGPGAFVIVANGFEDFARAIRQKMLLEISDRAPPTIRRVAERRRPPCDAGEMQLRQRGYDDF